MHFYTLGVFSLSWYMSLCFRGLCIQQYNHVGLQFHVHLTRHIFFYYRILVLHGVIQARYLYSIHFECITLLSPSLSVSIHVLCAAFWSVKSPLPSSNPFFGVSQASDRTCLTSCKMFSTDFCFLFYRFIILLVVIT